MNHDRAAGLVKQLRGNLKAQWGTLTNNHRLSLDGIRERIAGEFQERYGLSKEQVDHQLKEFLNRNRKWNPLDQ